MTKAQLESRRQAAWIARLSDLDRITVQADLTRAMQDVCGADDMPEAEYLTPIGRQEPVDLAATLGGSGYNMTAESYPVRREVDPYLKIRMAQ